VQVFIGSITKIYLVAGEITGTHETEGECAFICTRGETGEDPLCPSPEKSEEGREEERKGERRGGEGRGGGLATVER
jgi:hypothetical protein